VGLRGAKTAAYGIDPDLGIAIDVTLTGDTPKCKTMEVKMGKGAAIKVKDSSILTHPEVKKLMVEVAKENNIPYQLEILEAGGTDSGAIHITRSGVPSGVISIPCRYVHSPSEMVSVKDVESAIELLCKILQK
ncbi:MAG: M20/M25/M40 family metallo-hydrolase, partial [Lutispora sp.]